MKSRAGFLWMILPLGVFVFLAFALFVERSGISYQVQGASLHFLEPRDASSENIETTDSEAAECLILYDSSKKAGLSTFETIIDTLDSMRIEYDALDVSSAQQFDLQKYQTVVVTFIDLDQISQNINDILGWVESGGRVLFSIRPDPSGTYFAMYRKMGIQSNGEDFVSAKGVKFVSDLLPGADGESLGMDFLHHTLLPVQLEDESRVHLVTADQKELPLLWENDYGEGRFVVIQTDQFNTKDSRGIIGAAYSLLKDVTVYPVINSSTYFIDDFPGPIPEGDNEIIRRQFGRDIEGFYVNNWWPDMQTFARKFGLKYTGMMVETYNDKVKPPFDQEGEIDRYTYFGSLLLAGGGEIGLHGYNHIPFCPQDVYEDSIISYPGWSSTEAMQASLEELHRFGQALFPEHPFTTYVPPSNLLCEEARQWLPNLLPDLRVVASVYLTDENNPAYVQEFIEADDGIIEFPRTISGYMLEDYMWWVAINELGLHYVNSHFVHPDDVLDKERGAEKGWAYLRDQFEKYLMWIHLAAPGIRNQTASEGAMAVQRFYRLEVDAGFKGEIYSISLDNFYDEAWLMMRSSLTPETIDGGEITKIAENLYLLKANQPEIQIKFEE